MSINYNLLNKYYFVLLLKQDPVMLAQSTFKNKLMTHVFQC